MNNYFKSSCKKKVPYISQSRQLVSIPGIPTIIELDTIDYVNTPELQSMKLPYIDTITDYLRKEKFSNNQKVILLTDDEEIAKKAAYLITMFDMEKLMCDETGEEYEEYTLFDEYDYEDEITKIDLAVLALVDMKRQNVDRMGGNIGNSILSKINIFNSIENINAVLFIGSETLGENEDLISAVGGCTKKNIFIQISPDMMQNPEIFQLVSDMEFNILKIDSNPEEYYENFLKDMLSERILTLDENIEYKELLRRIRLKTGNRYSEERIASILDYAEDKASADARTEIKAEDFLPLLVLESEKKYDKLNNKTGLKNLKKIANKLIAIEQEKKRNPKAIVTGKNMIFYGNPGSGKTTGAALLAEVLAEAGCGNGKFVVAARRDLVGKYVGHTAHLVAEKFEEAKGGILFVDEAGFFLNGESGGFVNEALKEFVRYMECMHDVTVIFAMYPDESKRFLQLDAGLSSRISQFVEFEDYSVEELVQITKDMLFERGYSMTKECDNLLKNYYKNKKLSMKEKYGNARDARRLVDEMVMHISISNASVKNGKYCNKIKAADLAQILESSIKETNRVGSFGFSMIGSAYNAGSMNKNVCI